MYTHVRLPDKNKVFIRRVVAEGASAFVGSKNKPHINWPYRDNKGRCHCCLTTFVHTPVEAMKYLFIPINRMLILYIYIEYMNE